MNIIEEFKRRNVLRVAVAYLVLAWIVIQVTDTIAPALYLPDWTLSFVVWVGIIGFPFALLVAWVFRLTPDGLVRDTDSGTMHKHSVRFLNIAIVSLISIALVMFIVDRFLFQPAKTAAHDSIAVLPFTNMSGDASKEYFSDGLSEELLNLLARVEGLKVAARTSSFAFKGKNEDIRGIGQTLGVTTVLEGSVRQSGKRVRVTAQLIDVGNGYHLWSDNFDSDLDDIFVIQDQIASAIVSALQVHLETGESPEPVRSRVTDIEAYNVYLKGQQKSKELGSEPAREALDLFRAATEIDPGFAAAWAARARMVVLLRETAFWGDIPKAEAELLARQAIDRALELDPTLSEAYVSEAMLYADLYQYDEALNSLSKALSLNPNSAEALWWLATLENRVGKIRSARSDIVRALALDPLHERIGVVAMEIALDHYDSAAYEMIRSALPAGLREVIASRKMLEVDKVSPELYRSMQADPQKSRRLGELKLALTREVDEELLTSFSRNPGEAIMWIYIGRRDYAKAMAKYEALPASRKEATINLEELSIMLAGKGECAESLAALEKAHNGKVPIFGMISPNANRSNSNLALNRVFCLRALGATEEADLILARVKEYIDTLRANTVCCFAMIDAKFRVLSGDIDGALDVLEMGKARGEVHWEDRYDPVLITLSDKPRFQVLQQQFDAETDDFRKQLGMPPYRESHPL